MSDQQIRIRITGDFAEGRQDRLPVAVRNALVGQEARAMVLIPKLPPSGEDGYAVSVSEIYRVLGVASSELAAEYLDCRKQMLATISVMCIGYPMDVTFEVIGTSKCERIA